jgi:hypothetical protein
MINNTISIAEFKLRQHFENGEKSTLSIEEVAELMDVVTFGIPVMTNHTRSIFFSFS